MDPILLALEQRAAQLERLREATLKRKARTRAASLARRRQGAVTFQAKLDLALFNGKVLRSLWLATMRDVARYERLYKVDKRKTILDLLESARYRHRLVAQVIRQFRKRPLR